MFISGVAYSFGFPARMALRSQVIPQGFETHGNSRIILVERISDIAGPLIVGLFLMMKPVEEIFFVQSGALLCSGVLALRISAPAVKTRVEHFSFLASVREIFVESPVELLRLVSATVMVRALVITGLVYTAAASMGELFLLHLADTQFSGVSGSAGWLVTPLGVGGVLGAVSSRFYERLPAGGLYFMTTILEGLVWLSLPWIPSLPALLAVLVVAGFLESVPTVVYFAQVQEHIPDEAMGGFWAAYMPFNDAFVLAGTMCAPLVFGRTAPSGTALVVAGLMVVPVLIYTRVFCTRQPG